MKGKTINGFTLQCLLGTGGMAEVWYAENEIGMKAAVKIMSLELSHNAQMKERFLNEAKVMVKLDHPNIRKVFGYGNIDGRPAIIMEYLEGNDLKDKMKRGQRFSQQELVKWWNQLVDALNYTHAQDIVHRDIKPSNIFIDQKGNARLLDFGIAKVADTTSGTQTGSTLGTRIYMSPEQVKDPKRVGTPSDVYSLAVSFVHLLTGKTPYDSTTSSDYDIQVSIVTKPLDLSKLPDGWKRLLTPYLSKEPSQRPPLRPFDAVLPVEDPALASDASEATMVGENRPSPEVTPKSDEETGFAPAQHPQRTRTPEPSKPSSSPKENPKAEGKSKKGLWIALGAVAAAVLLAVLLLRPKDKPLEESLDTQAYRACQTAQDYREYLAEYGRKAEHYTEAKQWLKDYVDDSTAKAQQEAQQQAEAEAKTKAEAEKKEDEAYKKCTTVAACDSYLKSYPEGRYVNQVKSKKAELEKIAQQQNQQTSSTTASSNGAFSVSSGKKVVFAKGNLQYNPSSNSWRIASNPWDVIGEANKNISPNYSGWIDLFGWGTGNDPTKASTDDADYSSFTDWGSKYKSGWYTLTKDEWVYVFNKRSTSSGVRYAKAKVNGMNGVVLLPDDWNKSTYGLSNTNNSDASFSSNSISSSIWYGTFSPAGAVFLPAAVWRNGTTVGNVGSNGIYWSSSPSGSYDAYCVYFYDSDLRPDFLDYRGYGRGVRLVRPAEN